MTEAIKVTIYGLEVELEGRDMGFSTHPTNFVSTKVMSAAGKSQKIRVVFHRRHPSEDPSAPAFGTELYFEPTDDPGNYYYSRYYPENVDLPVRYHGTVARLMEIFDQVFDIVQDPEKRRRYLASD